MIETTMSIVDQTLETKGDWEIKAARLEAALSDVAEVAGT